MTDRDAKTGPPQRPRVVGMGKLAIPPDRPLPKVEPKVDQRIERRAPEPTRTRGFPGPIDVTFTPEPPPTRSFLPAPWSTEEELSAIEREAVSEGSRVERAPETQRPTIVERRPEPKPKETIVVHEYRLDPRTMNWLRGIIVMVLGALGLSGYAAIKPSAPPAPPVVPMACEIICPGGSLDKEDSKLPAPELHAKIHCCEIVKALKNSESALTEAANARVLAGKASDKATLVEQRLPKVNP